MSNVETARADGVLRFGLPGGRWLSTGWRGGFRVADAAYNLTVPAGFERTDLDAYVTRRLEEADLRSPGSDHSPIDATTGPRPPALLTGVEQRHARGAQSGSVVAVATVGLSNPAALPMDPTGRPDPAVGRAVRRGEPVGTVNLLVGTGRALEDGQLATLLATVVEARAATLLAETGYPGTTTDAVAVATDPTGEPAAFAGSATPVGAAGRACVRAAVRASLRARYADEEPPATVGEAEHGLSTTRRARPLEID